MTDAFLLAAIEEAERGLAEGGIPIGSVLVHDGAIIGRGHNRRVQRASTILHAEMDALENAGRQGADGFEFGGLDEFELGLFEFLVGRFEVGEAAADEA